MVFIPNRKFVEELAKDPSYKAGLARSGEAAAAKAEPLNPRIRPVRGRAMSVETDEDGVRVVNRDYGGIIAEYGSVKSPPYAPLRRGARAAGLRVTEQDR